MLNSMKDLLVENLRDLYSAETQLLKALPKMARAASSPLLAEAIEDHLAETEEHAERLREVFDMLEERPGGKRCHGMEGLIEEGREAMDEEGSDAVRDAAIIAAAQRVEHYEIAAYGCAIEYAKLLEMQDVADLLTETLDEEKNTDSRLSEIAETEINPQAMLEGDEEDDESDDGEFDDEESEELEYEEAER
jgi:ferritin-like metal-binding protein YciE